MAQRKTIETPGTDTGANPGDAAGKTQAGMELPLFESPSISPAVTEAAAEPVHVEQAVTPDLTAKLEGGPTGESPAATAAVVAFPHIHLRPRHKRYALLAACVAVAAAFGAVVGAATTREFSKPPAVDMAAILESKATQQSVAHLTNEIAGLKASLEAANKAAHSQIAKLSDRLGRETADVTASVTPPSLPASQAAAPLPAPRPPLAEPLPPARLSIVPNWSIRETRDGYVYVQGHGDVYQVVRARRCRASFRGTDQTSGPTLAGGDPEGHYRIDARPPLFRAVLINRTRRVRPSGASGRRSSFGREPGGESLQNRAKFPAAELAWIMSCTTVR